MRITVRDTADRQAALQVLQRAAVYATDGAELADLVDGCALLDVVEDGRTVGAVAVEIAGDVATIKAAASDGAATYVELALIEAALVVRGVRWLGMFTKRPALVRQLARNGYSLVEAHLRKEIGHGLQVVQ